MSFNLIDSLPVLLMFVVAAGFAITFIGLSQLVGQRNRTRTKLMPYECGKDPVGSARERFSVKFYLIAMLFILFDIEVIFLVPWAVVFKSLAALGTDMRWFVYLEMMVFIGLLLVGYIYVVKKGAFDCGEKARRQADVMIVSGRVSRKMAPVLRRIYDQMPEPKWVISMGACATSGGVFDNYAIVQGVDKIVPVDVYIPGCPPRPEMLIHAVMMLQDKVMKETIRDRRDAPENESREALTPGTLPVTDGSTVQGDGANILRPYTIASKHEKRRSF